MTRRSCRDSVTSRAVTMPPPDGDRAGDPADDGGVGLGVQPHGDRVRPAGGGPALPGGRRQLGQSCLASCLPGGLPASPRSRPRKHCGNAHCLESGHELHPHPLEPGVGPIRGSTYLPSTPDHVLWGRLPCAADAPVLSGRPRHRGHHRHDQPRGHPRGPGPRPARPSSRRTAWSDVLADAVALAATDDRRTRAPSASTARTSSPADRGRAAPGPATCWRSPCWRRCRGCRTASSPTATAGARCRASSRSTADVFSAFATRRRRRHARAAAAGRRGDRGGARSRSRRSSGSWASRSPATSARTRCRPGRTAATSTSTC